MTTEEKNNAPWFPGGKNLTIELPKAVVPEGEKKEESNKETKENDMEVPKEEKKPTYEEVVKKAGLTLDEARAIVDAVLFEGFYGVTGTIKKKISYKFRTRCYHDQERLFGHLEMANAHVLMHQRDIIVRFNLASSLEQYGKTVFKFPTDKIEAEDAFETRYQFVRSLPVPVYNYLTEQLYKLDLQVSAALSEDALGDF